MKVPDFAWTSRGVFAQPTQPIIYSPHIQKHPDTDAFAVMVKASLTGAAETDDSRPFTCAVEVDADENKPGWQDALKTLLAKECLLLWERWRNEESHARLEHL